MKKLTRVKLINWHRFTNTIIDFDGSTLVSGENGAGKSTLLDAIQFVVNCSGNNFNKAAHENGKRKLTGYIRCKSGKEDRPYERTGEISAHVALEFYEESRGKYFIVGTVIDSASEWQEKVVRYLIDDNRLDDELFFIGRTPKSVNQFRQTNAAIIRQWCTTEKDARNVFKNRFGRLDDKFFRLIPKALAFRPIDDIKDFVYSYVLDEKEVNIENLRENVRSFQDLQNTLENVKLRMKKLADIEASHQRVLDYKNRDAMYGYFLSRNDIDITTEKIRQIEDELRSDSLRLEDERNKASAVRSEIAERRQIRDDLRTELASDKDFIARDEQEKRLRMLLQQEQEINSDKKIFLDLVQKTRKQLKRLLVISDIDNCVKKYDRDLEHISDVEDFSDVRTNLEAVIDYKKHRYEQLNEKRGELAFRIKRKKDEKMELDLRIEKLQKKKLSYPCEVENVLSVISGEFNELGRKSTPRILCELLEITDESWRNAVEGYLNTQRFYILVDPTDFDVALGTFDRLRKEKKMYGVGLINADKLDEYDVAPPDSLATVVTSKNKYARRYINMVLGKVVKCDSYADLKKHSIAITRECMRYQNHVASAIRPSIFENPYIGQSAVRVQLEKAKEYRESLRSDLKIMEERIDNINETINALSTDNDMGIKYRIHVLQEDIQIKSDIRKCRENIESLEKNSNMLIKKMQLDELEKVIMGLESDISKLDRAIGKLEEKISFGMNNKESSIADRASKNSDLELLRVEYIDDYIRWDDEYDKRSKERSLFDFRDNYVQTRKRNQTGIESATEKMQALMNEYKTAHGFGAAATMDGFADFEDEYIKLRDSELLQYEGKVESARAAAEEEFREQFLSKLQENMKTAQSEFRELNKALKDIVFSNERYEFLFLPSGKYRSYYDMIMDDFNAMQGESIFSGIFHENHKAVIDELFERLALDNDNTAEALDEFTDYRTYMDYDIKILHDDGSYSLYSKVCEEKSGGETQTPFYVTVAASFVQLYKKNIGGESIGLVMFDEAFNNMDDERIGGVLEFFGKLPLQMIISAPPEKIQYISPSMKETLLLMTDGKVTFAEKYTVA